MQRYRIDRTKKHTILGSEIPEVDPDTMPDAPAVCAVHSSPLSRRGTLAKTSHASRWVDPNNSVLMQLPEKEESNKEPLMKGKDGVETGGRPLRALIRIMLALDGFMMIAVVLLASCMY
ncbi:hypothetical protein BGY98DRAFT_932359 [Russula aff. rugulosa BPL654]|nr:hypothetical protein BGY98DRAFT_932359 [Russula aff. rugulosa BPL654]